MNRDSYLQSVNRLSGFKPTKVVYHEVDYKESKPFWNESKEYDSVDFGIDLWDARESCISITWDSEFYMYGISVKDSSITDSVDPSTASWDVSEKSRWSNLIGKEIKSTKIFWSWIEDAQTGERTFYPQDLRITFGGGFRVFISAMEISNEKAVTCMDNLTVFFDEFAALKHGVTRD